MTKSTLKKILKVFLTLQWAKELPRQGFIALGFKRNEADSVAAHSWTTAILAYLLASEMKKQGKKIDIEKTLKMALFHDMAETIVGDVGTFVKGMAKGAFAGIEEEGLKWLVSDLPTKDEIISLVEEYSQRKTLEARVCKVADNLDALAQAKGVPAAQSALKYFKEIYHITKIPFHKTAVEMILKDEIISLVEEYSQRKTLEARVCKVANNLVALAQAKGVPAAQTALKYFKEIYHITKIPFHKTAVEMILKDEVEPERSWQKK